MCCAGFHLESVDGRKHTALSEAACQGHLHVIQHLLEIGADPNSLSDTGRSALWRAAFNGPVEVRRMVVFSMVVSGNHAWIV
jgi:ankyrin repeat protein